MRPQDQQRNSALAGCPCRGSGTIAIDDDMKNHTIVVGVGVVAVPAPVVRGPVDFNITTVETAVDPDAGTGEIGAGVLVHSARRENPDGQTV